MTGRLLAAATACAMSAASCASPPAASALQCRVEAPARATAGRPVMLRFTVVNTGTVDLQVLRWNTPFEGGWLAPFVTVVRDGQALPWQGPTLKRGDPAAGDYLRLAAGASKSSELDIALPVDLSRPGRYRVVPRIHLVDVFEAPASTPPRPRADHVAAELACPAVEFELVSTR